MPRVQMSRAGTIVEFFRTAPLETADLILGLCQDAVRGRKTKSSEAKARARGTGVPSPDAPPIAAAPAKVKKRKKSKKMPAAPSAGESQPGEQPPDVVGEYVGDVEQTEYLEPVTE